MWANFEAAEELSMSYYLYSFASYFHLIMLETSRFSGRILGICLVALPLTDQNWKRERDYVRDAFTH